MLQSTDITPTSRLAPPHGLQEIINVFGDIFEFLHPDGHLDPRWESQMPTRITLPFPLPLSWNPDLVVDPAVAMASAWRPCTTTWVAWKSVESQNAGSRERASGRTLPKEKAGQVMA